MSTAWSIVLGSVLGVASSTTIELVKSRIGAKRERETRWDKDLATRAATTLEAASRLRYAAGRSGRQDAATIGNRRDDVRAAAAPLMLLGSHDVQFAARLVVHEAYAVALVGQGESDPDGDDVESEPTSRLKKAEVELNLRVREQMVVTDASEVLTDDRFYALKAEKSL